MKKLILAIDFDGTLCEDRYPHIGNPNHKLINLLISLKKDNHKLILWTCRAGSCLQKALDFCEYHKLEFDSVNKDLPEIIEKYGKEEVSPKVFADLYIDDKNISIDAFIKILTNIKDKQ